MEEAVVGESEGEDHIQAWFCMFFTPDSPDGRPFHS